MISVLARVSRGTNVGHKTIIGLVIFRVGGRLFLSSCRLFLRRQKTYQSISRQLSERARKL